MVDMSIYFKAKNKNDYDGDVGVLLLSMWQSGVFSESCIFDAPRITQKGKDVTNIENDFLQVNLITGYTSIWLRVTHDDAQKT